jgi:hypothetical protein
MDMLIDGGAHGDFSQTKTCNNNNTTTTTSTKKNSEQDVKHDKTHRSNVHSASSSSTTTPLMEQQEHSDYDDDNITLNITPSSPLPPPLGTTTDGGSYHPKHKSKEYLLLEKQQQQQQEEYENHRTNKLKEEKKNHHHNNSSNNNSNNNNQNNNNLPSVIAKVDKGVLSLFQKICSSTRKLFISENHHHHHHHHQQQQQQQQQRRQAQCQYRRIPKVLLFGTHTPEEHFTKVNTILDKVKEKHSQEGLHLCGFDYQSVVIIPSCEDGGGGDGDNSTSISTHAQEVYQQQQQQHVVDDVSNNNENNRRNVVDGIDNIHHMIDNGIKHETDNKLFIDEKKEEMNLLKAYDDDDDDELTTKDGSSSSSSSSSTIHHNDMESKTPFHQKQERNIIHSTIHEETNITHTKEEAPTEASEFSSNCSRTRLIHLPSNTFITKKNRQQFIADGEMYEEIVRLCQEYAQDMMIRYGSLHWTSVCEDERKGNPIRALVHTDISIESQTTTEVEGILSPSNNDSNNANEDNEGNKKKPSNILLITTGKGKVRAGIFSRLNLLTSSIEESTALPYLKEASKRGMKAVILDPNARGDRNGMDTYEKSMEFIFGKGLYLQQQHQSTSLFILAHSASGSQLTRYLMDKGHYMLQHIRAIAFTDSSHSIQWVKHKSDVQSFLQDPTTLYIRSANENRDYGWDEHLPGEVCETDEFWKHRFGNVQTLWAGTSDHSLSNWTALEQIWKHFDYFF